ncbi:MAG: hypothetical protein LM558_02095 [Thermosphaera sp.]|nr:hypothetical protein [Thermosphaera sp.]
MRPKYKVVVYCSGCGFKLYEDSDESTVKFGGPALITRVYKMHGCECPVCGRKLSKKPLGVRFTRLKEYVDGGWFVGG